MLRSRLWWRIADGLTRPAVLWHEDLPDRRPTWGVAAEEERLGRWGPPQFDPDRALGLPVLVWPR